MNKMLIRAACVAVLLSGCAQLPPPPEDAAAKRFEPVPGKAVIYLARTGFEPSWIAPVAMNDQMIGSTYKATYMRIETPAGPVRLRGMAGDSGSISLTTEAGKVYYVQHTAYGSRSFERSAFDAVNADHGQALVRSGQITALIQQ